MALSRCAAWMPFFSGSRRWSVESALKGGVSAIRPFLFRWFFFVLLFTYFSYDFFRGFVFLGFLLCTHAYVHFLLFGFSLQHRILAPSLTHTHLRFYPSVVVIWEILYFGFFGFLRYRCCP